MRPIDQTTRSGPVAPGKRKRALRHALTTVLALIALVMFAEGVLRFGLGLGNPVLIAPDPACDFILKPHQNVTRFFSHTYINRYGMRSEEVPATRAPHSLRVMFVGDSLTYGTGRVDQSEIFSEVVHRDLPSIVHEPVEVLNASASAWAIDNELAYVRSRGIFQSDAVLLVLNSDDLSQARSTISSVGDELPMKRYASALGELYARFLRPRIFHTQARLMPEKANPDADGIIQANLSDLDAFRALVTEQRAQFVIVYAPLPMDIPAGSAPSARILRSWSTVHRIPLLDLTAVE